MLKVAAPLALVATVVVPLRVPLPLLMVATTFMPAVLTAWVRFALAKRSLAKELIGEATDTVSELTDEFREAMADSANFGPGKAIFKALQADGVDVSDETAVNAWLAAFNARPDEERYGILGPPVDA